MLSCEGLALAGEAFVVLADLSRRPGVLVAGPPSIQQLEVVAELVDIVLAPAREHREILAIEILVAGAKQLEQLEVTAGHVELVNVTLAAPLRASGDIVIDEGGAGRGMRDRGHSRATVGTEKAWKKGGTWLARGTSARRGDLRSRPCMRGGRVPLRGDLCSHGGPSLAVPIAPHVDAGSRRALGAPTRVARGDLRSQGGPSLAPIERVCAMQDAGCVPTARGDLRSQGGPSLALWAVLDL